MDQSHEIQSSFLDWRTEKCVPGNAKRCKSLMSIAEMQHLQRISSSGDESCVSDLSTYQSAGKGTFLLISISFILSEWHSLWMEEKYGNLYFFLWLIALALPCFLAYLVPLGQLVKNILWPHVQPVTWSIYDWQICYWRPISCKPLQNNHPDSNCQLELHSIIKICNNHIYWFHTKNSM